MPPERSRVGFLLVLYIKGKPGIYIYMYVRNRLFNGLTDFHEIWQVYTVFYGEGFSRQAEVIGQVIPGVQAKKLFLPVKEKKILFLF